MKRNTEDVERLKEDILREAEKVFTEKGYVETKMTDISDRLNISRGPLYYHYKNKNELFTATVEYHISGMLRDVEKLFDPSRGKKMYEIFMEDLRHRLESLDFSTCAHFALLNGGTEMKKAQRIWDESLSKTYEVKLQALRAAQKRGELRDGVTPERCVQTLFALYGGLREIRININENVFHLDTEEMLQEMEQYMRTVLFR